MVKHTGARNESWDWKDTSEKISMSERVGKILEALKDTACVHIEEREMIAYLEMYCDLFPEDKEFTDYLETQVIPAIKKLGYARWYRDVITDLGLALADKKRDTKAEHSAKGLLKPVASS